MSFVPHGLILFMKISSGTTNNGMLPNENHSSVVKCVGLQNRKRTMSKSNSLEYTFGDAWL